MTLSESSNWQRTLTGCRECMFFFLSLKLMFYTVNIKPKQFYIEFNKINRNLDSYLHVKKDITELIDFGNFINKKKTYKQKLKKQQRKKI